MPSLVHALLLLGTLVAMKPIQILPPRSRFLRSSPHQLSILSWNILLPNSKDGWWCYKTYSPRHNMDPASTEWPARRSLIRSVIERMDADIVCLQELCGDSFAEDFAFMGDLGYVSSLYKKGRFRPATFWKPDVVTVVGEPIQKDRSLILQLKLTHPLPSLHEDRPFWVANAHLQSGNQTARRLRQMNDCVETIRKEQNKLMKGSGPASQHNFTIVIAGDMNFDCDADDPGNRTSAVERLLLEGEVPPNFVEGGELLSKKRKSLGHISPFTDTYAFAWSLQNERPPPTMVAEELYSLLTVKAPDDDALALTLSETATTLLGQVFESFASGMRPSGERVMVTGDVEQWLLKINKKLGRGSEYRAAMKLMTSASTPTPQAFQTEDSDDEGQGDASDQTPLLPLDGFLTREMFISIYHSEMQMGKVWGVAHDLSTCGYPLQLSERKFQARYDRIYLQGCARVVAVTDTGGRVVDSLPNSDHPSDHLPLSCLIELNGA